MKILIIILNFFRGLIYPPVEVHDDADDLLTAEATMRSLGSYPVPSGHKIFAYDFKTEQLKEVTYELVEGHGPKGEKVVRKRMLYEKGMLYVHALNYKTAIIRVAKGRFIIPKNSN